MSLPTILKVTLKAGLSPQELQDVFNEISLINGLSGMKASPSQDDVLYCGVDGDDKVDEEIRKVPNVISVTDFPFP